MMGVVWGVGCGEIGDWLLEIGDWEVGVGGTAVSVGIGVGVGVVVVPVNWHWVADELAYVIQNSGSRAVLVDERFVEVAVAARQDERSSSCDRWIVIGSAAGAALPEGFLRWEELLDDASSDTPAEQFMGGPIFYTSGTTGFPKGVRSTLSTTGVPSAVMELIAHSFTDMLGLPPGGTTLLSGPAYHSAQWVFSVFPLLRGSTVVMRHRFDAPERGDYPLAWRAAVTEGFDELDVLPSGRRGDLDE